MWRLLSLVLLLWLAGCELPGSPYDPARCTGSLEGCDLDGDGSLDPVDCAPTDAGIHPGAVEVMGDLIDSNCNGDGDDDGASTEDDCDDSDPSIYPNAADLPGDGVDSNCDGDLDDDGDLLTDCQDNDPNIYSGAYDTLQDGVDSNCNGKQDIIYTLINSKDFEVDPATVLYPRMPTSVAVASTGILFFTLNTWYKAATEENPEAEAQSGEVWMYDGTSYTHLAGGLVKGDTCTSDDFGPDCFLDTPVGVATLDGTEVYFAVTYSNVILKVDTRTKLITRIAGNYYVGTNPTGGDALTTAIRSPRAVALDAGGDVYFTTWDEYGEDTNFHAVFRVNRSGTLLHLAGVGRPGASFSDEGAQATTTTLSYPYDLVVSPSKDVLFVDKGSLRIRSITPEGKIYTLVNTPAYPKSLDLGPEGSLYYFLGEAPGGGTPHTSIYRLAPGEDEPVRVVGRGPESILWEDPDYGDNVPARDAQLNKRVNFALMPGGGIGMADQDNYLIRYVVP